MTTFIPSYTLDYTHLNTNKRTPRNTMGIDYPDIISAHLQLRRITEADFCSYTIAESKDRHKSYTLLIDFPVLAAIKQTGEASCLVSFQVRTSGCFAVARLWDELRASSRKGKTT